MKNNIAIRAIPAIVRFAKEYQDRTDYIWDFIHMMTLYIENAYNISQTRFNEN